MKEGTVFTYRVGIETDDHLNSCLSDVVTLLSLVERKLFAACASGADIMKLKSEYIARYRISARHFNAIRINLQGKIRSIHAIREEQIKDLIDKIKNTENTIKKLSRRRLAIIFAKKLHYKKRLLEKLKQKLQTLQEDKKNNTTRMCFGSKKLFKKQFNLEDNNYKNIDEWRNTWTEKRTSQFYLIGSKDETMGNQSCVAFLQECGFDLRIRVPDALADKYGKHILLKEIIPKYGYEEIYNAMIKNINRITLDDKTAGQAINYRFLKKDGRWTLFITIEVPKQKTTSSPYLGSIGVDVNANHLAVSEIDNRGNLINSFDVECNTYGKSSDQSKAIIGDAVKKVVSYAKTKAKPIVIERLDFTKKKKEHSSAKKSRQLSSFCYSLIASMLCSKSFRSGIEIVFVNPAYSSVIGRVKFSRIYNISVHQAAALVLARRYYKFSERLPNCWNNIPNNKGCRVTLQKLAKISGRHVWHSWAKVLKNLQAVLAVHHQKFLLSTNCLE